MPLKMPYCNFQYTALPMLTKCGLIAAQQSETCQSQHEHRIECESSRPPPPKAYALIEFLNSPLQYLSIKKFSLSALLLFNLTMNMSLANDARRLSHPV